MVYTTNHTSRQLKPTNFILLGTTKENPTRKQDNPNNKDTYFTNHKLWGNPFKHEYFTGASKLYVSTKSWREITTTMTQTEKPNTCRNTNRTFKPTNKHLQIRTRQRHRTRKQNVLKKYN